MAYSAANLRDDLDAIAKIESLFQTALGDGTDPATIAGLAKAIRTRILGSNDVAAEIGMLNGAHRFYQSVLQTPDDTATGIRALSGVATTEYWSMLRSHYSDLATALADLDVRMHPSAADNFLKSTGARPAPASVFALATDMGSCLRTAGNWAFTDGDDIDPTLFAPAQLSLVPTVTIGAADVTVVLTLTPAVGAANVTVQVVIPAGSDGQDVISVGSGKYIDVVDVDCTGGTNADAFDILSVQERDPLSA